MASNKQDYGADPLGDGTFRMVPSGDIVSREERDRRLPRRDAPKPDCFGLTWQQLAAKQGGQQTLDITRNKKNGE